MQVRESAAPGLGMRLDFLAIDMYTAMLTK